jgi:hypothetical protein
MLDVHLAALYGVPTHILIQAVTRDRTRFPRDFMFRLTKREYANLRSQIVISSLWGGRRSAPYAFTEHGVAMLSSVLRSNRAISVNIEIVRAFVYLRQIISDMRISQSASTSSRSSTTESSRSCSTRSAV